jgi:hypothetical protein
MRELAAFQVHPPLFLRVGNALTLWETLLSPKEFAYSIYPVAPAILYRGFKWAQRI